MNRAEQYRRALLEEVMPYWDRHSLDEECGGYFTCLDRTGGVYDTDKFVWLQARQVWTYSMLYREVEPREAWKHNAEHGISFLMKNGMDDEGHWYFSLTREGAPLVQPYNIFSDCFAALALNAFAQISGRADAAEVSAATYRNILKRQDNPKGIYNKAVPGTRPLKSFALPMILCNLSMEMKNLLGGDELNQTLDDCIEAVTNNFYDSEQGLIHEYVHADGSFVDCFDGRLINPGHGMEALWFILEVAEARGDRALIAKAADIMKTTLDFGWDAEHGGLFYFMDSNGKPPQQLEWNQKLWWVHLEALVAVLKAYNLTGDVVFKTWFEKLHDYTWAHFPDPEFGEWFGYLSREGQPLTTLKGGKWKGCFHVPRGLLKCAQELEKSAEFSE